MFYVQRNAQVCGAVLSRVYKPPPNQVRKPAQRNLEERRYIGGTGIQSARHARRQKKPEARRCFWHATLAW